MAKFIKSPSTNFSDLFQSFNNDNTTINMNTYIIPELQQENNKTINNDDTVNFNELLNYTKNITVTDDKDSNNSDESKSITPKEVGATIAVGTTSILSGGAKVIEYIDDGVTWVGGKGLEGVSWLVGEAAGLFSEDKKNSIMDWRDKYKKNTKNYLDRDRVGELNEWFYENTKIGQDINEASYLKYDSEAAKTTQNITTKVTEIGGATALTILTGGAAAPLVFGVGCAEGIGKTAEKTYQNGGDFDDGTFSILLSGGLNGISWVANGKLGQGAFEIIKDAKSVGLLETGSTLLNDTLLNKEFWSNTIKNGLSLKTMSSSGNSVINVNALMNYGSSLMSIGGDFVDVLNSDEGFTPKNIMSLGKKYLAALGLNVLEDSGREYITSYKAGDIVSSLSEEKLINTDFKDIQNPTSATMGRQAPEKLDTTNIEKTLEKSGVTIYSRGIDIDATAKQIPINYLLKIVEDPDYTSKVLDGKLLDEIDGMSRLEIGNALFDLKKAMADNNLDLGLDEASLTRMDECINKLSNDPISVIEDEVRKMFNGAETQNYSLDYFISEKGQTFVKYLKTLVVHDLDLDFAPGFSSSDILGYYYDAISDGIFNHGYIPNEEQFIDVLTKKFNKDSISNEEVRILHDIMNTNNYHLYGDYGNTFAQYVKRANLEDAEQITAERLRKFTEGYVSDEKINSIYGSCQYETNAQFALHNYENWMAYNNGIQSVMNLKYYENIIRANVNHESIHQISNRRIIDPKTGARIVKGGVCYSTLDSQTGEWIKNRLGFNECITELFNKISMESEYPEDIYYCGYQHGVIKLEELIDTGIININELKSFYFNNLGEELISTLNKRGKKLGLGKKIGDELSELFDGSISNEMSERANSLNQLTRIITDIYAAQENKINQNKIKRFINFIKNI